jgi:tetratricopeptide (TPR) repeat protein
MSSVRVLLAAAGTVASVAALAQDKATTTVDPVTSYTPLVATYGVYAICLIFIFFAWRRATADLNAAPAQTQSHYQRIHTIVVVFTIVLAAAATGVWIYSTFIFAPIRVSRGAIRGLTQADDSQRQPGDPPKVYQRISAELPTDVESYTVIEHPVVSSDYQFRWAIVFREQLDAVPFLLQHYHEALVRNEAPDQPPGAPIVRTERRFTERRFLLKLAPAYPASVMQLIYEKNATNPESIGRLFLLKARTAERELVDFEKPVAFSSPRQSEPSAHFLARLLAPPAFAQEASPFEPDGDYDKRAGSYLRQNLASPDLQRQLAARAILVRAGPRSFKFISDALDDTGKGADRALLVHNLAAVVLEIERQGSKFAERDHLKMARALYNLGDYQAASQFYDRAGSNVLAGDASEYIKRGYTYQKTDQSQKALADYEKALSLSSDPTGQAIAHNAKGTLYLQDGRYDAALVEFNNALRLDRSLTRVFNNLAYSYAQQGENLDQALMLVDRALSQSPADPNYLDTKGWILFKQGKHSESVTLLEKAAKLAPDDKVLDAHLKQARAATKKGT